MLALTTSSPCEEGARDPWEFEGRGSGGRGGVEGGMFRRLELLDANCEREDDGCCAEKR